jgi:hypothetical protein
MCRSDYVSDFFDRHRVFRVFETVNFPGKDQVNPKPSVEVRADLKQQGNVKGWARSVDPRFASLSEDSGSTTKQTTNRMKHTLLVTTCSALAFLALDALSARADQTIGLSYKMPVHVSCNVNESGCNNNPGPTITIDGAISLGGLSANLIFQNNSKGTHTTTITEWATNISLLPLGAPISIPKQPVLGGVGGNPYIYMQFFDSKGNMLTDEMYLGRCVQGFTLGGDFLNGVAASTTVSSGGCDNKGGPTITMSGEIVLSGLKARIIFRNNPKGTHTAETFTDVDIIIDGSRVTIPKSPHIGGAGGNPLVLIQFLQGDGTTPITDRILLGRCNKV